MIRVKFLIKGVVQGVGFRPFIYKLANSLNLNGFVNNSSNGVNIEVEGDFKKVDKFEKLLKKNTPPLAKIYEIKKEIIDLKFENRFRIIESENGEIKTTLISPDIKVCEECLKDIYNPNSRFFQYFATNCTNCGARYSIIKTVPYDRKNTSMSTFKMCEECQSDYNNPDSRRYHAQPIACNRCGPKLELKVLNKKVELDSKFIIKKSSELIKSGKIGAIKGIGGFHIVCDATNNRVVEKLRRYKNRPTKPFAIMCKKVDWIKEFAEINKKEQKILESKEAPIVILNRKKDIKDFTISDSVAPNISKIGCLLPYTPLHFMLFDYLDIPIVATSANLSGEPIISDAKELESKLTFLDFILDFNREIVNSIDDSVIQVVNNRVQILRLARGYAPKTLKLPTKIEKNILSVGANQKNTLSFAFENSLILTPYIADLDSLKSVEYFQKTVNTFKRFYDFKENLILMDLHQNYESSKIAQKIDCKKIKIQHHIAHKNSVKAEFNLQGDFISFVFDGTGLGSDKTLWGGEVFVNDKRSYYFKPIKLIGGEKAIKEPKRVALSLLFENYILDEVLKLNLPTIKSFTENEIKIFYRIWEKGLNSPLSSSVGRLFDAVASLQGVCQIQSYEGEAGLLTEEKAKSKDLEIENSFKFEIKDSGEIVINWDFFDKDLISKFYATIIDIIINLTIMEELPVILSGGVFQNKTLLESLIKEFEKESIDYYFNQTIPINDSGISVGQIWSFIDSGSSPE